MCFVDKLKLQKCTKSLQMKYDLEPPNLPVSDFKLLHTGYLVFLIHLIFIIITSYLKELCNIIEASDSHKSSFPYVFS